MGVYRPAVLDVSTSPRTGSNHTFNSKHLLPYKHVFSRGTGRRTHHQRQCTEKHTDLKSDHDRSGWFEPQMALD